MIAQDLMTSPAVTIRSDGTLLDALRLMVDRRISGLPVVDENGKLVGQITEGDLLRRSEIGSERHRPRWLEYVLGPGQLAADYVKSHSQSIGDLMTGNPISISEKTPVSEIAEVMLSAAVKRLPVLENGRVIGVVSRGDLLRSVLRQMESTLGMRLGDEAIKDSVWREIRSQSWTDPEMLDISVRDGVVTLRGVIMNQKLRQALRVAAAGVPGVVQVVDAVAWVEPLTGASVPAPPA